MRTTYLNDRLLNHIYRATASTAPATVYAGLLTAVTDAKAGTVTEASYAGYARKAVSFAAPGAGGGGRQISNSAQVLFDAKTDAGTVSVIAVGVYDASTAGNLLDIIFLDGDDVIVAIGNDTSTEFLRSPAHGLVNDDRVRLMAFPGAPTLPAGLSENTTYWVVSAATDEFKLSTTQGGAAVNITAQGRVLVMPLTPKDISQNDQASFAAGQLKLAES